GNRENTDVGKFLREYLDLDDEVENVTKELVEKATGDWMGRELDEEVVSGRGDHYEGDFRKRDRLECGCSAEHVH
ncbi:MAG: hypothetical protein Q9211_007156, partial [Gyalolechia sp. 1 TL-2023]